jgi:hypothetical protein
MDTLVGLQKSRHSSLTYLCRNSPLSFSKQRLASIRYMHLRMDRCRQLEDYAELPRRKDAVSRIYAMW